MPRLKSVPIAKRPLIDDNVLDSEVKTKTQIKRKKSSNNSSKYDFVVDPGFQHFLSDANFYLTIHYFSKNETNDSIPDSSHCLLGSLCIQLLAENPFDICFDINSVEKQLIYLYAKHRPFEALVYYECNQSNTGKHFAIDFKPNNNLKAIDFDFHFIQSLNSNHFYLTTNLLSEQNCIHIDVWLQKSALRRLAYHSQTFFKQNNEVLEVMNGFYGYPKPFEASNDDVSNENIEELYSKIKTKHTENKHNIPDIIAQHPALYPTLRPYQTEAVQWMLNRERIQTINSYQLLYENFEAIDGTVVKYNRYLGYFIDDESNENHYRYGICQSGILADEMGLGKTIEVISTILCHPKPSEDDLSDKYWDFGKLLAKRVDDDRFACVCGQLCNIRANRRRDNIISDYNSSDTDIDSNNTSDDEDCDEEDNEEMLCRKSVQKVNKPLNGLKKSLKKSKQLVRCLGCGSYQHSGCVNYDPDKRQPYYCGHCWVRDGMKPVESRATLIVSPRSISHQWLEEILKHVNCSGLSIYVYKGVKSRTGYIQPFDLADNDIVLTTYETLRSELDFVDLNHSNRFRYPKRFNSTPSPLPAIKWWRICLDEAQMVESASQKTAQMAHRLHGTHRWCITGTPIQRSINDIYGLLLFIGEEPYHERMYWQTMLFQPFSCGNSEPLVTALSNCFWRTTKQDVWDQLGIPVQTSTVKTLIFSPIEQHFYLRQQSECQRKFAEKTTRFADLNIKLKELDKKTANVLMTPLLSLRQACCHPQAVRGKFLPISKKTLTMEELLKTMIKNTQYECEEEHRKFISSVNGLAAIHIIEKDYEKGIQMYRKALNSVENFRAKDLFRTDKLQQIHTLHNLAQILELCGVRQKDRDSDQYYDNQTEGQPKTTSITISVEIGRTLRDEYLKYESIQLHNEYLAKGTASVSEVTQQLDPLIRSAEELEESFQLSNANPWWKSAIHYLCAEDEHNLITRIKDTLEQHSLRGTLGEEHVSKFVSISNKFTESSGLVYVLDKCIQELHKSRDVLKKAVKRLKPKPTESELNEAIDCHLRPELDKEGNRDNNEFKCKYCKIHELFNTYEMKLYYFSAEEKTEEAVCKSMALMEKQRRGNWGDSETEQCLKVINQMFRYKSNGALSEHIAILEDGANHLKLIEALKKEFRGLRGVWIHIYDFVSQIDELNMATIRLRVRLSNEPKPKELITYILEPNEVSIQAISLRSDEVLAKNALSKKLSHLYYLNNLSNDELSRKGGHNPELCPICQFPMGQQWSVLHCGHCLCVKCLDIMITQYSRTTGQGISIQCALCRELCPLSAVLYVDSHVDETQGSDSIEVKGSWSTKVEEVVKCLLKISSEEPTAKTLVFSTWNDVLTLIANAFNDNKIKHILIKNSAKFSENIESFKQNKELKALLLPIELGAKGLNLIEATHVVLVEPTLNKANELQAVGRVHRIGQTKPTFVHRFIVQNTIEERISYFYSTESQTNASQTLQLAETSERAFITLSQMKELFKSD